MLRVSKIWFTEAGREGIMCTGLETCDLAGTYKQAVIRLVALMPGLKRKVENTVRLWRHQQGTVIKGELEANAMIV